MKEVIVGEYQGITVTAFHMPSVRGKTPDRLWLGLRQKGKVDRWEVRENLSYVHGVDILFRKGKKQYAPMTPKEKATSNAGIASGLARRKLYDLKHKS